MWSHRFFSTFWPSHGTVYPERTHILPHLAWIILDLDGISNSKWLKSDISSWSRVETYGYCPVKCCPTHLEVASDFFHLEQLIRLGPRTGAACAHTGKRSRQSELGQGKIVAIWRSTGWIWMDIRIHLYNLCIYGYPLDSSDKFYTLLWKITVLNK